MIFKTPVSNEIGIVSVHQSHTELVHDSQNPQFQKSRLKEVMKEKKKWEIKINQ